MEGNFIIVIPSLNPDEKLVGTVADLKQAGFTKILIIDDGSDAAHQQFFPADDACEILHHKTNRGKGAALKTAFRYIKRNYPDITGVITVDGDGQHAGEDVRACADAIELNSNSAVLGCRDFSEPHVPPRSRFGNRTTSLVFRLLCGMKISDTQTGLRAFPRNLLDLLISIDGERFEYETNMLLKFKQNSIAFKEVKIKTVYIEENKSSHFHPIKDSIRVYRFILAFFISSIISFLADISVFYLICKLAGSLLGGFSELVATAIARAASSLINFTINRKKVFSSRAKTSQSLLKYYIVALPQMLISAGLVSLFSVLFKANAEATTLIKIIVDTLLFFISYRIQQNWVFAEKRNVQKKKIAKKPISAGTIIRRSLLSVGTALILVLLTLISACLVITHGPSKSMRDMLVLSAKQASATKWLPGLFMPQETIDSILTNSQKVNTDVIDASNYAAADTGEWDNAPDGMKLIFLEKSKYKAYVLLVKDPARVKVGVSSDNFKTATAGKRIFDIAAKYNAVAAINGGEFADVGGMGSGATPMGLTYSFNKCVWNDGLKRTFIGFDSNNRLICRESITATEADALGIRDAVSFQNGNVIIESTKTEVKLHYSDNNTGTAQRTAIGQRADGTVILLVTDGRSADSIGATKNDVIDIMVSYGAVNAGMLDGGSSAMMFYEDYFNKYPVDTSEFDSYQQQGLVNRYKAFTKPRSIPTYFIVTEE